MLYVTDEMLKASPAFKSREELEWTEGKFIQDDEPMFTIVNEHALTSPEKFVDYISPYEPNRWYATEEEAIEGLKKLAWKFEEANMHHPRSYTDIRFANEYNLLVTNWRHHEMRFKIISIRVC